MARAGQAFRSFDPQRVAGTVGIRRSPDYIGVGPVFATPTKAVSDPVLGLERMASIARSSLWRQLPSGGSTAGTSRRCCAAVPGTSAS